jgi:hypothetical protein
MVFVGQSIFYPVDPSEAEINKAIFNELKK